MHEMTIVAGVLDIAHRQAAAADARCINRVVIEVGRLAGVEPESLRFCFAAARGGLSSGAELEIIDVPGRGTCRTCGAGRDVETPVALCDRCGSLLDIESGQELRVVSLNVD